MMISFLELADQTVDSVQKQDIEQQDIEQYSTSLNEAEKTSRYIHEKTLDLINTTLDLINTELTEYQELFSLTNGKIKSSRNLGLLHSGCNHYFKYSFCSLVFKWNYEYD